MTTIVYCHKTKMIAYDGLVTAGDYIMATDCKKFTKYKEILFFYSGGDSDINEFIELYKTGETKLDYFNVDFIVIKNKAAYRYGYCRESKLIWSDRLSRNHAIGSGGRYALGAVYAGSCVKTAVKIASQIDVNTGGRIRTYDILKEKHS